MLFVPKTLARGDLQVSKLIPEERETILRFDQASDECTIWTAEEKVATRLRRSGVQVVEEPGGWSARVPKQALRLKVGKRACYTAGRSAGTRADSPPRMHSASPKPTRVRSISA